MSGLGAWTEMAPAVVGYCLAAALIAAAAGSASAGEKDSEPYIGPFYPYPQVPLGWRKVQLEWDDSGYQPQCYFRTVDVSGDGVVDKDDYAVWESLLRPAEYLGESDGADFYSMDVNEDGIADLVAFVPEETGPVVLVWVL